MRHLQISLTPRTAVRNCDVVMGEHTFRTEIKPKSDAQTAYREATRQGHSAAMLSQDADAATLYSLELGNLGAGQECTVRISYLQLLSCTSGMFVDWTHVSTWTPPYTRIDHANDSIHDTITTPHSERDVSYTLNYDVHITSTSKPVTDVSTVSGGSEGVVANDRASGHRVSYKEEVADASRDFQLIVTLADDRCKEEEIGDTASVFHQRAVRGQEEKTVVLATFTPPLEPSTCQKEKEKTATEIIMVIDCSGSMMGTPIKQARDAALFFVKNLPVDEDIRFNVVCFGSTHIKMFPSSKPYDADSEQDAIDWISANVNADLGGTEIYPALESIYENSTVSADNRPREERHIVFTLGKL